ncbi:MAG: glycosyltransferase family 39 protein [Thermoflexales bacterium]|nr:glycosyltransferase family 39 protein [Thermoflexales bacterium]
MSQTQPSASPPHNALKSNTPGWNLELVRGEHAAYALILAMAAAMRLYRLGLAPLSGSEAAQALAAWHGTPPPIGASPVLYAINSLLFGLMGTSDGLARLGAAICGVALAGVPFFLRHRLGRVGALSAAAILAISPTAIMASRTLSGEVIVALASLGLLAAGERYVQTHERRWAYSLAILLALGLSGGSGIYTMTIAYAGGLGLWILAGQPASEFAPLLSTLQSEWKRLALILASGLVGLSTALLLRPAGLAAVGNLLSAWLQGFQPSALATSWHMPFQVMISYELLALLAGVAGLAIASLRNKLLGIFLGYWAAVALLIVTLRQGRTPQDMVLVITPLACLAAYAIEELAGLFRRPRAHGIELAFVASLLVILAFELLGLADYATHPGTAQSFALLGRAISVHRVVIQTILGSALLVIAILLIIGLSGYELALRNGLLAALIVLILGTWSGGWGAAQRCPGDSRELLAGPRPTSTSVRLMVATLNATSAQKTGEPYALPLSVVIPSSLPDPTSLNVYEPSSTSLTSSGLESVLRWHLRDFAQAQFVSALDESSTPYVVVAPAGTTPALASSYAGQDFAVTTSGGQASSTARVLGWLLYHQTTETPPALESVVVWVRQEVGSRE